MDFYWIYVCLHQTKAINLPQPVRIYLSVFINMYPSISLSLCYGDVPNGVCMDLP